MNTLYNRQIWKVIMLQRKNHYVPKMYLKTWSNQQKKIWTYRILVSHKKVPIWQQIAISKIPIYHNFYTKNINSIESDEIEKWFASEFESPAEKAISKAVNDQHLSELDWSKLIDFVAAQDVRTPVRCIELMKTLDDSLDNIKKTSNDTQKNLIEQSDNSLKHQELIPIRINKIDTENQDDHVLIHYEALIGRSAWLFAIQRLLLHTKSALHQQKWTILKSPKNFNFLTSDNPVTRLNYYGKNQKCEYDFNGGWGSKGTEIFIPLSPQHLMYTQIGYIPPLHGTIISIDTAIYFQKFIIENANRFVFSNKVNNKIQLIRPRIVNSDLYKKEEQKWNNWYDENTLAESQFFTSSKQE
jgi:hypothetical protein